MRCMKWWKNVLAGIALGTVGIAAAASAEELNIVGTGSGVEILKALGAAFTQQRADVTILVPESIGSSGGINAVGRDEAVLGRVSRGLKEDEQSFGLTYVAYAKNPIVMYVNKSANVTQLTVQQILDIYSGKVVNWSEVGGADAKIRVVTREKGDSSLDVLNASLPGFKEIAITEKAKTTFSDPETESVVMKTPGAIAYGSFANAKLLDAQIVSIGGKQATDADYPYAATLGFVYKEANYAGALKAFVEYAASDAAASVIKEVGGLPLK